MAAGAQPAGLDAYVDAARERQQIPGLSIAVVRNGELVHARGHGFANVERGVPATAGTTATRAT